MGIPAIDEDPAPIQTDEMKAEIKRVIDNPGLYWLHGKPPVKFAVPVLSIGGQIHQLKLDGELRLQFFENNSTFAGPVVIPS